MKGFGNNLLIKFPGTAFLCKHQPYFSNCNNKRMALAHVGICSSLMQRVKGYLVALKDFNNSCSLGYKRSITWTSKWRHVDEMNVARDLLTS